MRTLADIFAGMVVVVGILLLLGALVTVGHPSGFASTLFWVGLFLLAGGIMIARSAGRKTCPQCAERVKYEAKKCRHCGHDFSPTPQSAV